MPTLRTLIPPRFNDDYSFSGKGRWLYQRVRTRTDGTLELVDPVPKDGASVPIKG